MASQKKKNKQRNAHLVKGALKEKKLRLKRLLFYTSSKRSAEKQGLRKMIQNL